MKLAVIGAHSFIGSRIVESLVLAEGLSVVAISRHASQHTLAARFHVDLRTGDPFDGASLGEALRGCSVAIHALRGGPAEIKQLATALVEAVTAAGVRKVIYVSHAAAHGLNPAASTTEETRPEPGTVDELGQAHAAAERHVMAACRREGVTAFALRPGVIYGPRSPLIDALATELRDGGAWLVDSGDAVFNAIYVDNLIHAIRLCLKARPAAARSYLVADAEKASWRDLLHGLAHELEFSARPIAEVELSGAPRRGSPAPARPIPPGTLADRGALQQATAKLAFAAATSGLGYTPPVTFAEAVRHCAGWWRFAQGEIEVR